MLDKQTRTLIAQRLNQAEKQREQIRAISLDYPSITIEDAYAVQREWVEMKIAEGRVLKGHKIGLTSKAMQASSQISEPDYGALDRKSTRLNSSHMSESRMPSSA